MSVRRWVSMAVLVLVALGGLTAAGFADQAARPHGASVAKTHPSVTFLFVQNAAGGRLDPVAHKRGVFTLTLQRVDPHVFFFTDRPVHESGVIPTADMLQGLFARGAPGPNASVELLDGPDKQGVLAFTLSHPRYDTARGRLSYTAQGLTAVWSRLKHPDDRLNHALPRRFGAVTLYVDTILGNTCEVHVVNESDAFLGDVTFSKFDTDEWRLQPPAGFDPFGGHGAWVSGGTTPFTGCHNFVGYNLTTHGNTQPRGVNISLTNPFTGDVQESCVIGDPDYFCELDRGRSILHGAWVDVYWNIRKHPS